ncbi:MAG: phosphoribosylformylglycinamidine cyclo-ligase [Spirochaeta sp.]|jgi:phosphoribosylformylglycinamidine cyclo-ligase|nr:phosphoribosylformylglycinamidine cyclo-ligase [Spirochaeta sp.]
MPHAPETAPDPTPESAPEPAVQRGSYAASGVNRDEGYRTVEMIRGLIGAYSDSAAREIGSFAALHPIPGVDGLLFGAATDGVGTKIDISVRYGAYRQVGQDCVAMCVNDLACHGVQPLFFLDYLACDTLSADVAAEIVAGVAEAAAACGAQLIGGETAEMPGVYTSGSYDIAGFAVGTVSTERVIRPELINGNETLIAVPSSGLHSNGFSLIRTLFPDLEAPFDGLPLWQTLVEPTRLYPPLINTLLDTVGTAGIHGIAHITGGGLYENVPRILAPGTAAVVEAATIRSHPIFDLIGSAGVTTEERFRTFNMGIGLVLAAAPEATADVLGAVPDAYPIGQVVTDSHTTPPAGSAAPALRIL